jgi:hypothetical protein
MRSTVVAVRSPCWAHPVGHDGLANADLRGDVGETSVLIMQLGPQPRTMAKLRASVGSYRGPAKGTPGNARMSQRVSNTSE